MAELVQFFAPGLPISQGSKVVVNGRPMEDRSRREKLADWKATIRLKAAEVMQGRERFEDGVMLVADFVFERPPSHLKKSGGLRKGKSPHHVVKPDFDKIVRAVGDALTSAGVWRDDCQVCSAMVSKRYGETSGVFVTVSEPEVAA